MEYYAIKQITVNHVTPMLMKPEAYKYKLSKEAFANLPDCSIAYYKYEQYIERPAILTVPTFMVNETIKKVIEMYDDTVKFKSLIVLPDDFDMVPAAAITYGIPYLRRYNCVHEDSVIMPEGSIKRLVIDHKRFPNIDIFQIENIVQNKIIVSLRMAESISRRGAYGVAFERVEVK